MKNPVVLAPMAGVCNSAFRLTVKEFGAGLVCAEMVSDKGIVNKNEKTLNMLYMDEREKPLSLQIFGGEKESLVQAAKFVEENTNADIIDINMGCPVPKITKVDAGAKWLLDPNKIYEMVSAVVDAVDKPVTVKMRMGWDLKIIYMQSKMHKLLNVQEGRLSHYMVVLVYKCMRVNQIGILFEKLSSQ